MASLWRLVQTSEACGSYSNARRVAYSTLYFELEIAKEFADKFEVLL